MSMYPNSIARCQHIKVNGTQCGSPALRSRRHCFFHHRWRETRIDFNKAGSPHFIEAFALPVLEDANSVQVAIMQVLRLILAKHLDPKTAGLLLYGLQTASINLKHAHFEPYEPDVVIDPRNTANSLLGEHVWDPLRYKPCETEEVEDGKGEEPEAAVSNVVPEQDGGGDAPPNHPGPSPIERTRDEIRSLLAGKQHLLLKLAQMHKSP